MEKYLEEIQRLIAEKNLPMLEAPVDEEIHIYWEATYINVDEDPEPERIYVKSPVVSENGYLTYVIDIDAVRFDGKTDAEVTALAGADFETAVGSLIPSP